MSFPFLLKDHPDQPELARINPDASITVLDWARVYDWSMRNPAETDAFVVCFCQVLRAARYNFIETPLAESDRLGAAFHEDGLQNVVGNVGCRIFDEEGDSLIMLNLEALQWEVDWSAVLRASDRHSAISTETALFCGVLRLFLAGRDNFVVYRPTAEELALRW